MIRGWLGQHRGMIFHWTMEIVIVVIGILIAFALQGWAGDRESKRRGVDAERRIRREVLNNANVFLERIAVYPGLRGRIEALNRGLVTGGKDWRPATVVQGPRQSTLPIVYPVPDRSLPEDVYKGALGNGELVSASPERRSVLADLYHDSNELDALNREENALADRLQPLQLVGRGSPQERNATLAMLARLDGINALARLMAEQYLENLRMAGLRRTPNEAADFRKTRWAEIASYGHHRYGSCWDAMAIGALDPAALQTQGGAKITR